MSARSLEDRYFLLSNIFSSSKICLPVNVVRTFFFLTFPSSDKLVDNGSLAFDASSPLDDGGVSAAGA